MSKLKIEIKNRWTGSIIFSYEKEDNTIADTVKEYIRQASDKKECADLTDADLSRADLTDANLSRADLTDANLSRADLTDADLTDADLSDADLTEADLTGADLTDADLTDADLSDADLTDADLTDADLSRFKNDLWVKLLKLKHEIPAFKEELKAGRVKGTCYEGACSCFCGTMAKLKHLPYNKLPGVKADSGSPVECWFLQISEGDTPENSGVVKLTMEWIEELEFYINA